MEGHLVSHIYQAMVDDIGKLDLPTVQNSIMSFISELKSSATTHQTANNKSSVNETPCLPLHVARHLISSLVSLLEQYICLADGFLLSLLTAHKATSKLLSVLLGVFTELVEKGFCLPPEVEEEDSGEGATEFEDIQDGGLGEGEGAKDVSDQIENEDQVSFRCNAQCCAYAMSVICERILLFTHDSTVSRSIKMTLASGKLSLISSQKKHAGLCLRNDFVLRYLLRNTRVKYSFVLYVLRKLNLHYPVIIVNYYFFLFHLFSLPRRSKCVKL